VENQNDKKFDDQIFENRLTILLLMLAYMTDDTDSGCSCYMLCAVVNIKWLILRQAVPWLHTRPHMHTVAQLAVFPC